MKRLVLTLALVILPVVAARAQSSTSGDPQFRAIYQELVEINTTDSAGVTTKAADAMSARLKAGGVAPSDIQVLGPHPKKGNLVARLRGSGARKPLLLLAHLDVVEARREDWTTDPFKLVEKEGYFYARGAIDDKAMAAIFVDTLIRLKREGFKPNRDVILALTADEELGSTSKSNGVVWLLKNHRSLIEAALALNEGGGGELRNGRHLVNRVQTSEKVPLNFRFEALNPGGHSARPIKDNAIYHLADALMGVAMFDFPPNVNEAMRLFFERSATLQDGQLAADMRGAANVPPDRDALDRLSSDPTYNALLRTTCVATRLEGGHASNALPQMARATVNCRILPQDSPEEIHRTLVNIVANGKVIVTALSEPHASPPSPLDPEVMRHIERITAEMWPGVLVIPTMSTGATDGRFLRTAGIPTYGVSGLFVEATENRAHGKDERIGVKDLYAGREFLYRLVKALASGQ